MSYISLAKYTLKDDPEIGQSWQLPASVTASVDLTPPALDGVIDDNPLTNHAICLSDEPLDSNDLHYSLGTGNVSEMMMSGTDRDAWESIAGYRPQADTIADCIAEHLLRSPGQERANPLTCGFNRGLEVHLGERIWNHTLAGLGDPLALPVLQIEAEGLAKTYLEQGEQQYRLAMGGLRKKYDTRPVKELIQYLFPSGRDDLPLLDELTPQTVKTENWPNTGSTGVITSGQDFPWVVHLGSWTVPSAGTASAASSSRARMAHTFPGADYLATFSRAGSAAGPGVACRADVTFASFYMALAFSANYGRLYKFVSGASTLIANDTTTSTNSVCGLGAVGSTITATKNGSIVQTVTDTAVATGSYCGLYNSGNGAFDYAQVVFDDLISGGGGGNRRRRVILMGGW